MAKSVGGNGPVPDPCVLRDPASAAPLIVGPNVRHSSKNEIVVNGSSAGVGLDRRPAGGVDKRQPDGDETGKLLRCSRLIISSLERVAFKWGICVARRPLTTILLCLVVTAVSSAGLLWFQYENDPMKLWIPRDSEFLRDVEWMKKEFPDELRHQFVIVSADNVLVPEVLREVWWLYNNITEIKVGNLTWQNFCAKIPQINSLPVLAQLSAGADPTSMINSGLLSVKTYCKVLNALPNICLARGILELWDYDFDTHLPPGNSTLEEVLEELNSEEFSTSPRYGLETNFTMFLGGVVRNSSRSIVSAKSTILHFVNQKPRVSVPQALKNGEVVSVGGSLQEGDPASLLWEEEFLRILRNWKSRHGASVSYKTERSFGDLSNIAIASDIPYIAMSCVLMYGFVALTLGRFDCIGSRIYLSVAGIVSIFMAFIVACGVCSAMGIVYSPVHNLLVLLMQGLGVDDMFVILKTWDYAASDAKAVVTGANKFPLHYRIGLTMQSAGISITVTSLTDFAAFVIGGLTILPALQSFCAYAAVGILVTYLFQVTLFLSFFVLDQARIENGRNGLVPCIRHPVRGDRPQIRRGLCERFFSNCYSRALLNGPVKAMVILTGLGLVGFGAYGVSNMRQLFELSWFLPEGSYLVNFLEDLNLHYPHLSKRGYINWGSMNYSSQIPNISLLDQTIQSREDVILVDSWAKAYEDWSGTYFSPDAENHEKFEQRFSQFLFSPAGAPYQRNFFFNGSLTCGAPIPPILASRTEFVIGSVQTSREKIGAMQGLREAVDQSGVNASAAFPWSFDFSSWETDRFISSEVLRNLLLAAVSIFVVTVVLIANFYTSFWVLLCVGMTLVTTTGVMHFWGLTIEIVTSINLILAIGLCVDYAAHIGHMFMTCEGTRDERVAESLSRIGPAVLSGGFSTFLSLSVLAFSKSYVFMVFFRVFFLTCLFGLFFGLVFLPVILSLVGPAPYFVSRSVPSRLADRDKSGPREIIEYEFESVL